MTLDGDVARATLEFIDSRRGHLLLHAGGVAAPDGRVLVVHGESGAGKTTLTAHLVAEGLAYVTDETVCLDPATLAVEPYPKPLTVKPGSQRLLSHLRPPKARIDGRSGSWQVDPAALGGPPLPEAPLRPSLIAFPDFTDGYDGVQLEPVSRARAAFVLGEQSSALWAVEPRPLAAVVRLVTAAPAYRVTYGAARVAAPTLGAALAQARPSEYDEPMYRPAEVEAAGSHPRWADGVDWVELDGEAVLFDGSHLHHLDLPGAAVWTRLDGSRSLDAVTDELAEAFAAERARVGVDVDDLVRVMTGLGLITQPG